MLCIKFFIFDEFGVVLIKWVIIVVEFFVSYFFIFMVILVIKEVFLYFDFLYKMVICFCFIVFFILVKNLLWL